MRKREQIALEALVDYLRVKRSEPIGKLEVLDCRGAADRTPDARAGRYLIEHTSIEALPKNRRLNATFRCVTSAARSALTLELPCRVQVWLEYEAIARKFDPKAAGAAGHAIGQWVSAEVEDLSDGRHRNLTIQGVPFPIDVVKGGIGRRGLHFGRFYPENGAGAVNIRAELLRLVPDKLRKLADARSEGDFCVLLIEAHEDHAVSENQFIDAWRAVASDSWTRQVEVFFIQTSDFADVNVLSVATGAFELFNTETRCIEGTTSIAPSEL